MDKKKLYDLVRTDSPEAVLDEVLLILQLISPDFDPALVTHAYITTIGLYEGIYPGYQACNTEFHDLRHSIETFLAMARLIHGAASEGRNFTHRQMVCALAAAIMHDAGYIQEDSDLDGTGAKYTVTHVARSMDFLERYAREEGLPEEFVSAGRIMVLCTDLAVDIAEIDFPSPEIELLGKMLGTADLLAQMADRTYLEKLLFLYNEFSEAKLGGYESEVDLLRKTIAFYDFIGRRLKTDLDSTDRFMDSHFRLRWEIRENLYDEAIAGQREYLQKILQLSSDPSKLLRRNLSGKDQTIYRPK